jgi:hypothetical protein
MKTYLGWRHATITGIISFLCVITASLPSWPEGHSYVGTYLPTYFGNKKT